MDVDIENLITLLFPDISVLPDDWKYSPDIQSYLTKLGSFGLENIRREPARINEAQAVILQLTQNVAFENYKTFIHTAECSREICSQFNYSEKRLSMLIDKLPLFTKSCESFVDVSNDINLHRRLNSLTLTRNAELLELLELPQLMDTCIRNGNYEEALELAGYVRRLGKKHGQIRLITVIVNEVELSWMSMLHNLLSQLRTDLQLPKCLQIVGFLRRMEQFTEAEIRLKFLQARDTWLQSLLAAIPTEDAAHHLSKTIELSRIHLFNIVTQYRAIFSDEEPLLPSAKYQNVNECIIFYSWITLKVSQFLKTLEIDLNRGVGSSLDSALGQCMYFGLSFSRVGADFRGLLAPIFVDVVTRNLEQAVRRTTKKLEQDMEQFSFTKTVPGIGRNAHPTDSDKPPTALLEFYPLADFCNGLVSALNDLRACAPLASAPAATTCLQDSLSAAAKCTLAFYRQEQQALTQTEKQGMTRLCAAIAFSLIPHVQKCLHAIYPPESMVTHTGVSLQQLKDEGCTFLDVSAILDPIEHLMPVVVEPVASVISIAPAPADVDPASVTPAKVDPANVDPANVAPVNAAPAEESSVGGHLYNKPEETVDLPPNSQSSLLD